MRAYCKKYYPYEPIDDFTLSRQLFYTGETYRYDELYYNGDFGMTEKWYLVIYDEYEKAELFDKSDFDFYFIDTKKQRKIKLYNLANEQDIQRIIYGE